MVQLSIRKIYDAIASTLVGCMGQQLITTDRQIPRGLFDTGQVTNTTELPKVHTPSIVLGFFIISNAAISILSKAKF